MFHHRLQRGGIYEFVSLSNTMCRIIKWKLIRSFLLLISASRIVYSYPFKMYLLHYIKLSSITSLLESRKTILVSETAWCVSIGRSGVGKFKTNEAETGWSINSLPVLRNETSNRGFDYRHDWTISKFCCKANRFTSVFNTHRRPHAVALMAFIHSR